MVRYGPIKGATLVCRVSSNGPKKKSTVRWVHKVQLYCKGLKGPFLLITIILKSTLNSIALSIGVQMVQKGR